MANQYTVCVPENKRVVGCLYDYNSGMCMGIASDEQRKLYPQDKQPFILNIAGCPHKLVIHE